MNPVFVFLVLIGTALLWLLLSGLYRFVGGIAEHFADNARRAMNDEETKPEAFVRGFRDALNKGDENE